MRIIDHVCDQTFGGSVFRIAGHELLLILPLEKVEYTGTVSDDFQVGVMHGQLSKSENASPMVDVCRPAKWGLQGREALAGVEELDDFAACNADASDATFEVWGRRKGLWSQNNIVAYDLHSPPGIL